LSLEIELVEYGFVALAARIIGVDDTC